MNHENGSTSDHEPDQAETHDLPPWARLQLLRLGMIARADEHRSCTWSTRAKLQREFAVPSKTKSCKTNIQLWLSFFDLRIASVGALQWLDEQLLRRALDIGLGRF